MHRRFVLLQHAWPPDRDHWDLMLEHDGVLMTWQLPRSPIPPSELPMPAGRIQDHRLAYLQYEGPISHDRGQVHRVDGGRLQVIKHTAATLVFRLQGRRLTGAFQLTRVSEDRDDWTLACDPSPDPRD